MRKIIFLTVVGIILCLAISGKSFAGEVDLLVNKLVEKDVLTPVEAQILLDETKTAVAQEIAEGKSGTLRGWIQKIKLKGDIRTRYQNEEKKKAGQKKKVRERGRVRFRLKGEGKVTKGWKVGFGLATGGDDPRSTNQTMENNFSTKGIQLDYAYLQHSPNSNLDILAGKFIAKKNLWLVGDLLWDGDVNPEGLFIKSRIIVDPVLEAFLNGGWMIIEHVKYGADPTLVAVQPGLKWDVTDGAHLKGSLNY
ncbi:putative porin, partial [bacterium]|nr:putative porin [bacterium]